MFRTIVFACALGALAAPLSWAGTLRVGVPEINGDRVALPVLLEGDTGGGVAALDFTLNYDPAVFTPVGAQASAAAQAANKQVESNEVTPGNYVVMMFGVNQTTVANGQIATITLTKKTQPSSNQSDVSIARTTFASIEGQEIASEGSSQTVTFQPPAPGGGENENPPPSDQTPPPTPAPSDTPPLTPTPQKPPVTAPDSAAPGVPGGTPTPPDTPDTDSPRVSPMIAANSIVDERAPHDAQTRGVARMGQAAQQLEQSRAALKAPMQTASANDSASDRSGATDSRKNDEMSAQAPTPISLPREDLKVASAATAQLRPGDPASAAAPAPAPKPAADASGIPPRSRLALTLMASAIAVCLIAYRFTRRSAP